MEESNIENTVNQGQPEAWKGHDQDDIRYGNPTFTKEDYLRAFNAKVLKDHPDFDKSVLAEFSRFFDLWEREFERLEQVSAQGAPKLLMKYLKY